MTTKVSQSRHAASGTRRFREFLGNGNFYFAVAGVGALMYIEVFLRY